MNCCELPARTSFKALIQKLVREAAGLPGEPSQWGSNPTPRGQLVSPLLKLVVLRGLAPSPTANARTFM